MPLTISTRPITPTAAAITSSQLAAIQFENRLTRVSVTYRHILSA